MLTSTIPRVTPRGVPPCAVDSTKPNLSSLDLSHLLCDDNKQYERLFLAILLPSVTSDSRAGDALAIAYIGAVGFFTGLLTVATSAQLFLSHLVSRYLDAASPIKTFSKLNRVGWFVGQTVLTIVVGAVVFAAPYGNARWIILGERDSGGWSRGARITAAISWTIANSTVLFDTMLFSIMSLKKIVLNREKGGALLVLMAASGASDFINIKKIRDALAVVEEIDDVEVWHQPPTDELRLTFRASGNSGSLVERLAEESEAVKRGKEAEERISSSLLQIGAPPFDTLKVAALRANFRRVHGKKANIAGQGNSPAIVRSELSPNQYSTYRALLNTGREAYWRFTVEKTSMGRSRMCEPRIAALDMLHTHRRMAKWQHDNITVRNSVLHWARSRAIAEWVIVLNLKGNFTVGLKDARVPQQVNANWWRTSQQLWQTFSVIDRVDHVELSHTHRVAFEEEIADWRQMANFGQGDSGYQEAWLRDKLSGLDNLGHGKDWSEVYVFTEQSGSPPWGWKVESADGMNMMDALDFRGSGENVGGMTASGWYSLLILDMCFVLQSLTQEQALQEYEFGIFTIGLRVLGMIRVATRRAGRHELVVRGVFPKAQPPNFLSADMIYGLGCAFVNHCGNLDVRFKQWWEDEKPAVIQAGSIEAGDFVAVLDAVDAVDAVDDM